ncbi:AzlC family ABC transporter permease [Lapidilactobacillus achengensis]|uniref:AzlC family ABC transporter permease n=1 Tax=Lapidilactobacillus achengensis TaxID=2486000 RepID=A0ABW1UNT3_9LACO|nr:AzlC family ABC transporter permease [Lapidilactobacillus achengensis]
MDHQLDQHTAVKETLPTVFGYLGIGIAFGVVGRASGFSPWLVLFMSLFIYAGSAQFITVSLLVSHSPIISIVLATFLVNARMILLSLTIAPYFKQASLAKNIFLGTLLTDESFALGMNKLNFTQGRLNFPWFNTVNLLAYATWNIATLIGALIGNYIADPQQLGLDFAIIAMFIGLLYLQVSADRSLALSLQLLMIGLTLALSYFGAVFIPSNLLIIVVTIVGCSCGVFIKHRFYPGQTTSH